VDGTGASADPTDCDTGPDVLVGQCNTTGLGANGLDPACVNGEGAGSIADHCDAGLSAGGACVGGTFPV